jgi:hypothetical protein
MDWLYTSCQPILVDKAYGIKTKMLSSRLRGLGPPDIPHACWKKAEISISSAKSAIPWNIRWLVLGPNGSREKKEKKMTDHLRG